MHEKVAQRIKQLRLKNGLSQEGLSHLAELDRKYIGIIEKVIPMSLSKCFLKYVRRWTFPSQNFFEDFKQSPPTQLQR